MLKGQDFDLVDLANRYSLINFAHFKVTLRDKMFFELGVIETEMDFSFKGKNTKKRKVIYACNTKWIHKQVVPPGYESGFVSYDIITDTYDYEISYMDIFVECDERENEIIRIDSQGDDIQIRKLFGKAMENFAYKYNEAAAGRSFLDPVFYTTTSFFFRSFFRDELTGGYQLNIGKVIAGVGGKEALQTMMWDINKTLNSKFVMWRFYLNKARYCFSVRMYIDSVLFAAIAIEAYLIQVIKESNEYEAYMEFANKGKKGFTTAKNYIRQKKLLAEDDVKLIDKSYKKIVKYRTGIVHGDAETPYLEPEVAVRVSNALESTFREIEEIYEKRMNGDELSRCRSDKCFMMSRVHALCEERQYGEAIKALSENIENGVYEDLSYFFRAYCYSQEGLFAEAIKDYTMCIERRVRLKDTYSGLAYEYTKIEEYNKAIEMYDLAIKVDGNNAKLYYYKANTLLKLEKYYDAKEEINKAIGLEVQADYYHARAVIEAYLKEWNEAIEDYSSAISIEPDVGSHWYGRGQIYFKLAVPEKAESDIITAIRMDKSRGQERRTQELLKAIRLMYLVQDKG